MKRTKPSLDTAPKVLVEWLLQLKHASLHMNTYFCLRTKQEIRKINNNRAPEISDSFYLPQSLLMSLIMLNSSSLFRQLMFPSTNKMVRENRNSAERLLFLWAYMVLGVLCVSVRKDDAVQSSLGWALNGNGSSLFPQKGKFCVRRTGKIEKKASYTYSQVLCTN